MDIDDILTEEEKEKIKADILKAKNKFLSGLNGHVFKMLENSAAEVLGMEKRFNGRWTIDHCNSRNSVLANAIKAETKAALDHWIQQQATELVLDNEKIEAIKDDMKRYLERALRSELRRRVESVAVDIAGKMSKELAKEITTKTEE